MRVFRLILALVVALAIIAPAVTQAASTPLVVAYTKPSAVRPGKRSTVTVFGAGFGTSAAAVSAVGVAGGGITVTEVRWKSADRLQLKLNVAANAAVGARDVTVTLADGRTRTARQTVTVGPTPKRLSGRVRAGASGVANARVTIFKGDLSFFRELRSAMSGRWTLANVPPGAYRLGVAAEGYDYIERELLVPGRSPGAITVTPESHPGSWAIVGDTSPELFDATDIAILMADGRLFYCHDTVDPVVFDPLTGAKSFPASSPSEQGCTAATLLADDRIVFIGGQTPTDPGSFRNAVPWVKSYRSDGSWELMPNLQLGVGRWYPGLARLADGSLLVMGGGTAPNAERTDTAERFDLSTETWTYTGSMLAPAEYPPAALLYTGDVLATWAFPQLYDPVTGVWRMTGGFVQPNRGWPDHSDHSLVMLDDGRALAIGIRPGAGGVMGEIYDPQTGMWSLTANSALPRSRPEVVQLPDGSVLVAAGDAPTPAPVPDVLGVVRWTDLYNARANRWRRVADMAQFREYHAITLLVPDGRVLTTGGTLIKFQIGPTSSDIEAYSPPYLFRGVRPVIGAVSSEAARGTVLTFPVFPATEITSAVLVGTGAHTHWVDGGVPRRLVLPVTQAGPNAELTLPSDPNILPLGHYILFAMADDVPSVGRIVRVTAD